MGENEANTVKPGKIIGDLIQNLLSTVDES
jgi:hypothetical protein